MTLDELYRHSWVRYGGRKLFAISGIPERCELCEGQHLRAVAVSERADAVCRRVPIEHLPLCPLGGRFRESPDGPVVGRIVSRSGRLDGESAVLLIVPITRAEPYVDQSRHLFLEAWQLAHVTELGEVAE